MKAITIHQPWATLIALGEKRFETRSWPTKHRGPIAIHAGKKVDREACEQVDIKSALDKHGLTADTLPTGVVVATSRIADCLEIHIDHTGDAVLLIEKAPYAWIGEGSPEFAFGWYSDGRYAWELIDIKPLMDPIPAKGQQGLWNWEATHES
ncbi:ASCH domain-containing protein [Gorillibacterium sp. CAU 1737]|uniref:ASCH domain-containing protein n=1 Tax=Gorillibacterium sp. CAU 1737 TaxID=3140362 RepID=UPI003260CCC2